LFTKIVKIKELTIIVNTNLMKIHKNTKLTQLQRKEVYEDYHVRYIRKCNLIKKCAIIKLKERNRPNIVQSFGKD